MRVQQFDYPQWLAAVRTRLASLRPDVSAEDLDPNACMRAFRAGQSPHDFASRPVLPLKVAAPAPTSTQTANARGTGRDPRARAWPWLAVLALVIGLCCLAALKLNWIEIDTPETKRMRSVAQAVSTTYAEMGLSGAEAMHPGIWLLSLGTHPGPELPLKIASPRVGKVSVGGGYGEAEIECVGEMANGTKQPGTLSLQYDFAQDRVGIVLFRPSK